MRRYSSQKARSKEGKGRKKGSKRASCRNREAKRAAQGRTKEKKTEERQAAGLAMRFSTKRRIGWFVKDLKFRHALLLQDERKVDNARRSLSRYSN